MILERFIVLEGLDGNGKSTVMPCIAAGLRKKGKRVQSSGEPTAGGIGKMIRAILRQKSMLPHSALPVLYAADRCRHLYGRKGVIPYLERPNNWAICSRYVYSSLAYQRLVAEPRFIARLNRDYPLPQFLFYIDLKPEACLQRLRARRGTQDILEQREPLREVYAHYRRIIAQARRSDTIVHVIDGEQTSVAIGKAILECLLPYL